MAASVPLEELHGALVALRGRERLEGAEIPPLARARILLARVEAELARLELPDHAAKLLIGVVARHGSSRAAALRCDGLFAKRRYRLAKTLGIKLVYGTPE